MASNDSQGGQSPITLTCTILFVVGAMLVILFMFLPLLAQASLSGQQASIDAGDLKQKRLDDKLSNRKDPDAKPPTQEAQDKRAEERKKWDKSKDSMRDDLEESQISVRGRQSFYTWGLLFGFLILAGASVGFLSYGPTTARRVVGGIVIVAEILMIFSAILHFSFSIALGGPGH